MKKIVCEMCGSNDLLKKDGVFECQSCGTKYTVEEAKKMMVEGTVNVAGTVKIDNSEQIENYLKLATAALESSNNKEAENYANKIIEIEPKNYQAWFIKGKAAGWQSTLDNVRFAESIECWSNVIEYCGKDNLEKMKKDITDETTKLSKALINIKCKNFGNNPTTANANRLLDIDELMSPLMLLIIKASLAVDNNELFEYVASNMNSAAIKGAKEADNYFGNSIEDKNKYRYTTWIEYTDNCLRVLGVASTLSRSKKTIEQIFKNRETLQNKLINSCSYKYSSYGYIKDTELTPQAVSIRKREIANYPDEKQKLFDKIDDEQREKRAEYWKEHPEEKEKLEKEIADIKAKIKENVQKLSDLKNEKSELDKKINVAVPSESELKSLNKQVEKLEEEKNNLGLFKLKERKAVQEKIDAKEEEIAKVNKKIEKEKNDLAKQYEPDMTKVESKIDKLDKEIEKSKKLLEDKEQELNFG